MRLCALILSLLAILSQTALGLDWPQWRGPDRTDVSTETGLLQSWPADGPKLLWLNRDAGLGYSGASVVDGKVFTMGARGNTEYLIALDAATGRELWSAPLGEQLENGWGDGPRGTPAVDLGRVYALSGKGDLICAQAANGKVLWRKTMQSFGGSIPKWGYAESVLVDGNKLVCTPGGDRGAIVALDKADGRLIWQSKEFTEGAQYASIIPAVINNNRHYIQLTMKKLVGLAARDGKVLWQVDWPGRTAVIPTPIEKDGHVYVSAGYGVGSMLTKIGPDNKPTKVYQNKVMKNQHGGVILVGEHLYGYSDGPGWVCQNFMTGEEVWSEKRSFGKGSVAYADGRLYCVDQSKGEVVLVEASPRGWQEHGRFTLTPQTEQRSPRGKIWTHPVISNGRLYLRDQELFFCFDVKDGARTAAVSRP